MNEIIMMNGDKLKVGDTVWYVHPECHKGTIEKFTVESFWHKEYHYGYNIRLTKDGDCQFHYIWESFFGKTCFTNRDEAVKKAKEQQWSPFIGDAVKEV